MTKMTRDVLTRLASEAAYSGMNQTRDLAEMALRSLDLEEKLAVVEHQRDGWVQDCRRETQNVEYYRGLLDAIGKTVGPAAYTADDGSVGDEPLRAKLPALVASLVGNAATEPPPRGHRCWAILCDNPVAQTQPFITAYAPEDEDACRCGASLLARTLKREYRVVPATVVVDAAFEVTR